MPVPSCCRRVRKGAGFFCNSCLQNFFWCQISALCLLLSDWSGIHPTIISESFQKAVDKGVEVLTAMSRPVELSDRETLLNSATTSLCSKVVSQYSSLLAPMSVDAVMRVIDPATATSVDLQDIKIIKKLG